MKIIKNDMDFMKIDSIEFLIISRWARWKNLKSCKISKVLGMEFSIVENLSGLSGNIFSLSRILQLHFNQKSTNWPNYINIPWFPRYPPVSEMHSPVRSAKIVHIFLHPPLWLGPVWIPGRLLGEIVRREQRGIEELCILRHWPASRWLPGGCAFRTKGHIGEY